MSQTWVCHPAESGRFCASVARLIPDRATIELGLGAIPQAVTRALGRKQAKQHPWQPPG